MFILDLVISKVSRFSSSIPTRNDYSKGYEQEGREQVEAGHRNQQGITHSIGTGIQERSMLHYSRDLYHKIHNSTDITVTEFRL